MHQEFSNSLFFSLKKKKNREANCFKIFKKINWEQRHTHTHVGHAFTMHKIHWVNTGQRGSHGNTRDWETQKGSLPRQPALLSDWLEPIDIRRTFSCTAWIYCSVQKVKIKRSHNAVNLLLLVFQDIIFF